MRKVFWCCLLSSVAAAGVTRWAAEHADCWAGRTTLACAGVTPMDIGPPHYDSQVPHECVDLDSLCCQELVVTPHLEIESATMLKGYEVTAGQPDGSKIEIPDLELPGQTQIGFQPERADSYSYTGGKFIFTEQLQVDVKQNAGGSEECEDGPRYMPLAKEDDEAAPAFMPYLHDDQKTARENVFSFCTGFFGELLNRADNSEDCEPPVLTFDPNECREDPGYHHQYPGCPFSGPCPTRPSNSCPKTITPPKSTHDEDCDIPEPIKSQSFKPITVPNDMESLLRKTNDNRKHIDTTEYRPTDALPGERKSGLTPF